jgi:polyisoprenoid-binding protein YceI
MTSLSRLAVAATLGLGSALFAQAQATTWKIDPAHSATEFSIRHMGLSNVHGRFAVTGGQITLDPADPGKASVNATIDVTSIDTGVAQRDNHLKSPDFFDAAKYPTMTFVSKSVAKTAEGYSITGDLTMHGVTRPVVLAMDPLGKEQVMSAPNMPPQTRRGFEASTTIHRQDFGLNWNGTLKSGDAMLGDDVKVTLDVEAIRQ